MFVHGSAVKDWVGNPSADVAQKNYKLRKLRSKFHSHGFKYRSIGIRLIVRQSIDMKILPVQIPMATILQEVMETYK